VYPYLAQSSCDLKKSQIFLSSMDELRDDRNPYDISFTPSTLTEGRHFDTLLNTKLSYRRLSSNGTIRVKRDTLRAVLEAEMLYDFMTKLVSCIDQDSAFCAVEDAIPCIMHGGNRVGKKIFMMLLLEVWCNCVTHADRMSLIETVENFVNRGVFGTEQSRSQWKLPVNKEKELEQVSFTAWRVRKLMDKLCDLAAVLFQDMNDECLRQWQEMLQKYLHVIWLAFQHDNFRDEEIEEFQELIDEWYYLYIELLGLPGVTNYMHLLGAGHLYHNLKKWGNLYRY
jgi:hypothetical protein